MRFIDGNDGRVYTLPATAGIPRFPGAGSSARGQSAPKARPKGVADGHGVNIPQLAGV